MNSEKLRYLKPHFRLRTCLVKYGKRADEFAALSILQNTLSELGVIGEERIHLRPCCHGCNDPECTYDNPNGYVGAKW